MTFSYIAINRMIEQGAGEHREQREMFKREGRPMLATGREMSDAELLEKLKSFQVILDREEFAAWCKNFLSAEALSEWIIATQKPRFARDFDQEWIWVVLTVLWERWFPENPSFEMIDDQMQAGYNLLEARETGRACELWLAVWKNLLNIANTQRFKSLDKLDEAFAGSQAIFNWVQDLEMELWNKGLHDWRFLQERARFCEEFLSRFPHEDGQLSENMKRAWAESCFSIGETIKAEALFQQWLDEDPSWGWGWIGWSDCYRYLDKNNQDLDKAEKILRDGLSVKGVRDKKEIQNRLAALYAGSGKELKLSEGHSQLAGRKNVKLETTINASGNVLRLKRKIDFGEEGLPVEELSSFYDALQADFPSSPVKNKKNRKIGRNEPCPCGSGKKYKLCCGKP
jgi:uncharacterized protein YchJ